MDMKKSSIAYGVVLSMLLLANLVFILSPQKVKAANIPTLTTQGASSITSMGAILNGTITSTGSPIPLIRGFNYGITTGYGAFTAEQTGQSEVGYGTGAYTKSVSGLACGTTYHYQSYAVNNVGPGYGNDVTFTTGACNSSSPNQSQKSTGNDPGYSPSSSGRYAFSSSGNQSGLSGTRISKTVGFGGKVTMTKIPNVTCTGNGTLVVLASNLTSGISSLMQTKSSDSTVQKVASALKGLSGLIPFYATDSSKKPEVGKWILGKANTIPDTSSCKMQIGPYKIPYPVRKTSNYQVSGKTSGSGSSTSGAYYSTSSNGTRNYE